MPVLPWPPKSKSECGERHDLQSVSYKSTSGDRMIRSQRFGEVTMKTKTSVRRWMTCLAVCAFAVLARGLTLSNGAQAPTGVSRNSGQTSTDAAKSLSTVSITGLVRQPLRLGLCDIRAFGSVTVRRVDHRSEGFFGDFEFRGVPLVTLISMAAPRDTH